MSSKVFCERKKKIKARAMRELAVSRATEQKVHRRCNVKLDVDEGTSVVGLRVTGFGSTGVCCPSARQWLVGHLCPRHCCLETHHAPIYPLSASVTRCDRFLQREVQQSLSCS